MNVQLPPLDEQAVRALVRHFLLGIEAHYTGGLPIHPNRILEVLNALGIVAGHILTSTNNSPKAREFFDKALHETITAGMQ